MIAYYQTKAAKEHIQDRLEEQASGALAKVPKKTKGKRKQPKQEEEQSLFDWLFG